MHEIDHLLVTPGNEPLEGHGVEIHLAWYLQTGIGAEEVFAVGAVAAGGERIILVGPPIGIVEVEPIHIQVVLEVAEVIGQPVPVGRVETEPTQVLFLRPSIVEHFHQPFRVFRLKRFAIDDRVICEDDDSLGVGLFDETRE